MLVPPATSQLIHFHYQEMHILGEKGFELWPEWVGLQSQGQAASLRALPPAGIQSVPGTLRPARLDSPEGPESIKNRLESYVPNYSV